MSVFTGGSSQKELLQKCSVYKTLIFVGVLALGAVLIENTKPPAMLGRIV